MNCCCVLKASEVAMRSVARRRVRKSRGEQEHSNKRLIEIKTKMLPKRDLCGLETAASEKYFAKSRGMEKQPGCARRTAESGCSHMGSFVALMILSTSDCKQTGAGVRKERAGGDLAVEFLRPAAGDLTGTAWASALGSQAVIFDQISVAPN